MQSRIWYFKANTATQIFICFLLLFGIPVLPESIQGEAYLVTNVVLIFVSATLVQHHNYWYVTIAAVLMLARIVTRFFENNLIILVEDLLSVLFFSWISIVLIKQVVKRPPGVETILEAIAGYLLLGISCTFVMGVITAIYPGAFALNGVPLTITEGDLGLYSYFVFITYTTVGFGDILPVSDIGMAFAKFVAMSGQIYISVIIAILIGKYLQAGKFNQ
jgi:voltage-gated potassium channel